MHRGCVNCCVDKDGNLVTVQECAWRCSGCGHVKPAHRQYCRGFIRAEDRACGHNRSITGALGAEYTQNDWICPRCEADDGTLHRMWVSRDDCRRCNGLWPNMVSINKVRDYPEGTKFLRTDGQATAWRTCGTCFGCQVQAHPDSLAVAHVCDCTIF